MALSSNGERWGCRPVQVLVLPLYFYMQVATYNNNNKNCCLRSHCDYVPPVTVLAVIISFAITSTSLNNFSLLSLSKYLFTQC